MNVSDALLLPSFEGATVIAGRAGLDREVSTAMIVEAPRYRVVGQIRPDAHHELLCL